MFLSNGKYHSHSETNMDADLSLVELAALTARHPETLRRLARMGKLPGVYRLGGRWMIARASADKLRSIQPVGTGR